MRDVFDMSRKKLDRAAVLEKLADGRLTSHDDAALLDLSRRHVRRLQAAYRGGGAITLARGQGHAQRGLWRGDRSGSRRHHLLHGDEGCLR